MKNENYEIAILLESCKENNQKAQLTLYNKYYRAMFNVAYRIIGDKMVAEDIMQESFLKAFNKLDSYSGNVTFGAWLKKIVINTSITELKKSNKYHFESLNVNVELVENCEETINYSELKTENVLKTIQNLKPNYKIILTLFFIEGYDLKEITQILNISYENSRTMLSRAKESLRKKLYEL